MSDMFGEYDDQANESNAMRVLREKAEADSKALREMREQLEALTSEVTTSRVEKVVTSQGYAPGVAALAVSAGASTPEAVEAWLKDNGSLFVKNGVAPSGQEPAEGSEGEQSSEPVVPTDEQAALAALAAAAQGSTPAAGLGAIETRMSQIDDPDEFIKFLQSNGKG